MKTSTSPGSTKAKITVTPSTSQTRPISPYLTGKFCEHLRDNILNGMSAQILRNPSFADYPIATGWMTPDGVIARHNSPETIEREYRRMLADHGWEGREADKAVKSYFNGMAMWWTPSSSNDDAEYTPDTSYQAFGNRAQRISSANGNSGVSQWTYLPLHRIRKYEVDAWVRAGAEGICACNFYSDAGELISRTVMTPRDGIHFHGEITIPNGYPNDALYRFELAVANDTEIVIERVHLYPADHIHYADPDVIKFLRDSKLPLLRWPGGNFVSCYHWRDGVGPIERRPTLINPAWGGVEPNYFGTDEFIRFCEDVGCEPMICINAGDGTPQEAAEWLEYCNGDVSTPMGSLRANNGHPEPYHIKLWEIGNEIWGRWQTHWTNASGYVQRYHTFVNAMKKADPTIEVMGCGAPVVSGGKWNSTLIKGTAPDMQCITDHPLIGGTVSRIEDPLDVFKDFMGVPSVLARRWSELREEMIRAKITDPKLAVTELQLFAHLQRRSEEEGEGSLNPSNLVNPPSMAEALYDVLIYHEAVRLAPFVEIVTHSATVNHGGGLRKERERVYANPCHYAQTLFSRMHGAIPMTTAVETETIRMPVVLGDLKSAGESGEYGKVDALVALTLSGNLALSIVNRTAGESADIEADITSFCREGQAILWILGSEFPWERNTLENPEAIIPKESRIPVREGKLSFVLPSFSYAFVLITSQG